MKTHPSKISTLIVIAVLLWIIGLPLIQMYFNDAHEVNSRIIAELD